MNTWLSSLELSSAGDRQALIGDDLEVRTSCRWTDAPSTFVGGIAGGAQASD